LTPGQKAYQKALKKLNFLREKNGDKDSQEEDDHIDSMDDLWWKTMTQEDRDQVQKRPLKV